MSDQAPLVEAVKWLRDKAEDRTHAALALVGQIEAMQKRVLKLRGDAESYTAWADQIALLAGDDDERH